MSAVLFVMLLVGVMPVRADCQEHDPGWSSQAAIAAGNMVMGAATAGMTAWLKGQDVSQAFLRGAAGGGVIYFGKRIASQEFPGAGFSGREIGAVGSSVVASAGRGEWLEQLWMPIGPIWIDMRSGYPSDFRINLADVATLAWAVSRDELKLDWHRSLSSGVPVFLSRGYALRADGESVNGVVMGSTVLLDTTGPDINESRAHESVHVIQNDLLVRAWGDPLESHLWGWAAGHRIPVDLGLTTILSVPLLKDLHQAEAEALEPR